MRRRRRTVTRTSMVSPRKLAVELPRQVWQVAATLCPTDHLILPATLPHGRAASLELMCDGNRDMISLVVSAEKNLGLVEQPDGTWECVITGMLTPVPIKTELVDEAISGDENHSLDESLDDVQSSDDNQSEDENQSEDNVSEDETPPALSASYSPEPPEAERLAKENDMHKLSPAHDAETPNLMTPPPPNLMTPEMPEIDHLAKHDSMNKLTPPNHHAASESSNLSAPEIDQVSKQNETGGMRPPEHSSDYMPGPGQLPKQDPASKLPSHEGGPPGMEPPEAAWMAKEDTGNTGTSAGDTPSNTMGSAMASALGTSAMSRNDHFDKTSHPLCVIKFTPAVPLYDESSCFDYYDDANQFLIMGSRVPKPRSVLATRKEALVKTKAQPKAPRKKREKREPKIKKEPKKTGPKIKVTKRKKKKVPTATLR